MWALTLLLVVLLASFMAVFRHFCAAIRRATGAHLSVSLCIYAVICSGVIGLVCTISFSRCLRTSGCSMALFTAALSLSTMSRGNPAGPESEYQVVVTRSG